MIGALNTLKNRIKKTAQFIAGPHIIYWVMPWFMLLLVIGTIEQKDIGLYDSVQIYIYNFILWVGPIPLPGGGMALAAITISLLIKFLFYSAWSWKRSGIIISHLGSLLLLLGGFVTMLDNKEGFMIIPEGQEQSYFQDYHNRGLFITSETQADIIIPFENLSAGQIIMEPDLPFNIHIIDKCDNCDVRPLFKKNASRKGLASEIYLIPKKSEVNKEENFSGVTFALFNRAEKEKIGEYITLEDVPEDVRYKDYSLSINRKKTDLPFSIALKDFRKIDYPGSNKASDYQSDLTFKENDIEWPVTIRMNKPYRYKGYSIFQSSFDQRDGTEITVLNIVKNSGRLLPYISAFIIFLGLFIHLISRTVRRNSSLKKAEK